MTHFNDHNHNLNEVNFDSLFLYLRARLRKRDDPGRIVNHFKIIIGMLTMPLRGVFFEISSLKIIIDTKDHKKYVVLPILFLEPF